MIKPADIEDDNWEIIVAAAAGDATRLGRLLDRDPTLSRRGYFDTPPIHFAVREGHAEIVRMQTMLHICCRGDGSGRPFKVSLECAALLLDEGANTSAKDDDFCSTPLGWAARNNRPDMVDFVLARGAKTNLPDDEPWASPLAWAKRRGHTQVAERVGVVGPMRTTPRPRCPRAESSGLPTVALLGYH
jgi:ankyrin repeat protein